MRLLARLHDQLALLLRAALLGPDADAADWPLADDVPDREALQQVMLTVSFL